MVSKRMKTTPAMACLKTMLTIFSFIFLVIGCAVLGFGAYARIKLLTINDLSTINFTNVPWAMIAIGAFIIIVGIMGCCATIKGNTCLLRTYGLLLGIVFLSELAGAICAIIYKGQISKTFKDGMDTAVSHYNNNTQHKESMDNAQETLQCCGVNSSTDYWNLDPPSFPRYNVPASCCMSASCKNASKDGVVYVEGKDPGYIYDTGCYHVIFDYVNNNLIVIIGTMFGVAFFQVIGIILACCLASTINSNKYELV